MEINQTSKLRPLYMKVVAYVIFFTTVGLSLKADFCLLHMYNQLVSSSVV